jgi:hypothetical protein
MLSACINFDKRIGKDLEGSERGLIEVLSRNLPGGTEGTHEKSYCRQRFDSRTSRVRVWNATVTPTLSVTPVLSIACVTCLYRGTIICSVRIGTRCNQ